MGTELSIVAAVKKELAAEEMKKRFESVLGEKAAAFMASITSLVGSKTNFNEVAPPTILAAAFIAATLDLPINPNLGFAYIIPYKNVAQFQMGYKGFIQLALRTGQYKTINATEIYEGELVERNRLTGVIKIDTGQKKSDTIIGYAAYFQLVNGFEKSLYMSLDEIQAHGKRYSQSYAKPEGLWRNNLHAMALKTVLKMLLSKYGILSTQMQRAIGSDQVTASFSPSGEIKEEYIDGATGQMIDPETGELLSKSEAVTRKAKANLTKTKAVPLTVADIDALNAKIDAEKELFEPAK